jgi:hypothetical protein
MVLDGPESHKYRPRLLDPILIMSDQHLAVLSDPG